MRTLYPIYCCDSGVGHICLSVCQTMRDADFDVLLTVPSTEPRDRREFVRDAVPPRLRAIGCRKPLRRARLWATQQHYLRRFHDGDVAYIWPGTSTWVYEELKKQGHTIVMERINCHRRTARRILDDAYRRLGWAPAHGLTDEQAAEEQRRLGIADLVFCPSPLVRQSMLDAGVPAEKLISTSYGWDPQRFSETRRLLPPIDGVTVVFVGLACVRKGIHLLLNVWAKAGIQGRLLIVGNVEPDVARGCADQLNRPDVLHIPHCDDVAALYRSADVFAFPTLEEGSPLVSYEALACGLPVMTSPMGAGEIVRDGCEGIVLDPYGETAWIDNLRRLAADPEWRSRLGGQARLRAQEYTWSHVGRQRRLSLKSKLDNRSSVACVPTFPAVATQ